MKYYVKAFQNFLNFKSRANRSEYWFFILFHVVVAFGLGLIGGLIKVNILGNIYALAALLPTIAVGVRRMHDVGKSGWYLLIPIYNLILACTEGTRGFNQYGEDSIHQ